MNHEEICTLLRCCGVSSCCRVALHGMAKSQVNGVFYAYMCDFLAMLLLVRHGQYSCGLKTHTNTFLLVELFALFPIDTSVSGRTLMAGHGCVPVM